MTDGTGDGRLTGATAGDPAGAAAVGGARKADPDSRARTHLANERTFLAWLRTGLGLMVLGLGSAQFLDRESAIVPGVPTVSLFGVLLILIGVATVALGAVHYGQSRDRIEAEAFRPAGRSVTIAAVLVVAGGLAAAALVLLLEGA